MPRSLATSLLIGLFLVSGQAESRSAPAGESYSVAAKKQVKKKRKAKKKKKKKKKYPSTGVPADDKILEHQAAMLEIQKKNMNDCQKIVDMLKAYSKKHFDNYQALAKQRNEAIANMSAEEKAAYAKNRQETLYQISKVYWDVITDVDNKCPYHKVEIRISMEMFK